jgi:DNA-binding response OmpR family regulator
MTPKFLFATEDRDRFSPLARALENRLDADIHWAASGKDALTEAGRLSPLLVVMDEVFSDMTGLDLAREMPKANALINIALVSRLSPEDFHEASEGLGILVQLPESPAEKEAENIVSSLKGIFALPPD